MLAIILKGHGASLGSFHDGVSENINPIAQLDRPAILVFENNYLVADENIGPQLELRVVYGRARVDIPVWIHARQVNPGLVGWRQPGGEPGSQTAKPAQPGKPHPKANPTFGKAVIDAMVGFGVVGLGVQHYQNSFPSGRMHTWKKKGASQGP